MSELQRVFLRSLIRSWRRHVGYLLACTLAVSTFFTFGFFVTHPDVKALVSRDYAGVVVQLLLLGQIGVALFAVFFVCFFHRFLIRLRAREFGILSAVGMSPAQLARMVRMEAAILAGAALAIGFLVSLVETYAMFQAVSALSGSTALRTVYDGLAVVVGIGFFLLLFLADGWHVSRSLMRSSPKHMLTSSRRTQQAQRPSAFRAAGGAVALATGYTLALGFGEAGAGPNVALMLPIVILVVTGTWLLFSEILIAAIGRVRRRTVSGLLLLSTSRLAYRVRDFAGVLTVVSALSAGVLALLGVGLGVLDHIGQMARAPAEYKDMLQVVSLLLFVLFFLSLLFFVAALSTLYVKLFTQLEEDRVQFSSLRRLGISDHGVRTMISREIGLLFALPAIVACAHSAVAMGEFTTKVAPQNLSQAGVWASFSLVVFVFLILIFLSWFAATRSYRRSIQMS